MSRKVMLAMCLGSMMLAGGCDWQKIAHLTAIHVFNVAAGLGGLTDLCNLLGF